MREEREIERKRGARNRERKRSPPHTYIGDSLMVDEIIVLDRFFVRSLRSVDLIGEGARLVVAGLRLGNLEEVQGRFQSRDLLSYSFVRVANLSR